MNLGSVAVFEGEVPYDRLVENLEPKMYLTPRYRQSVIPAPLSLHHPTWEFDPRFDVRKHVIPVRLDPPGNDDQLRHLSARLFQGRLSRDKPMWEMYLVHGLQGGRSAIVFKVHHCLADGVAGIELLRMVLDVSPDAPPPPAPDPHEHEAPQTPDAVTRLLDAVFDRLADGVKTTSDIQEALLNVADNPSAAGKLRRALEVALPYFAVPGQRAPFNASFSGERRIAWSDCDLAELRPIRKACGATVNDVVLTVLGGALGRYYEAHGQATEGQVVRVLTPVNLRCEDDQGALGNRISMLLVEVPLDMSSPIERLNTICARMGRLKRDHIAEGIDLAAESLGNLPPMLQALFGALPKPPNTLANLVCTNIPGPMIPLYAVGHRLQAHYPLMPIAWEMGIGCAVTGYNQRLYFGLMADARVAPDVERLGDFLVDACVELRVAAGVVPDEVPAAAVERPEWTQTPAASAVGQALAADAR